MKWLYFPNGYGTRLKKNRAKKEINLFEECKLVWKWTKMKIKLQHRHVLKIFRLARILTLTSAILVNQLSNQLSYQANGGLSWNWFVTYLGKIKMKWWMYEFHILEPWNKVINAKKIIEINHFLLSCVYYELI